MGYEITRFQETGIFENALYHSFLHFFSVWKSILLLISMGS